LRDIKRRFASLNRLFPAVHANATRKFRAAATAF
jgi:hypothetical protein